MATLEADASVPADALFSYKKTEEGETTKIYYSTNTADFKTENLSGATEIKILGNITLEDDVVVNLGNYKNNVITVAGNATLNLADKNLTVNRNDASGGQATVSGISWTDGQVPAIVIADGSEFTVEASLKDKIYTIGENMNIRRFVIVDGNVCTYIHGSGVTGVIVDMECQVLYE